MDARRFNSYLIGCGLSLQWILVKDYVGHYNTVGLNSAFGYITAEGHARRASPGDSGRPGSEIGGGEGAEEVSPPAGRMTDETDYFPGCRPSAQNSFPDRREVLGDECATFGDQLLRVELECVAQGLLIFKGSMDTNNSRRSFLKGSAIAGAAFIIGSPAFVGPLRASVIVVGAGAFGGWSALQMLRKGAKVT